MAGTLSKFYFGAVEGAAGDIVSRAISSITGRFEMQEELDLTLFSLQHEVSKIKSAIDAAKARRITNQMLLEWLSQIIDAAYLGEYYYRTFKNQSSQHPMLARTRCTSNFLIDPTSRATKRRRTIITGMIKTLLFGNDEHKELYNVLKKLKSIDIHYFIKMVNTHPERPMKRYLYMDHTRLIDGGKKREQVMKFLFEPSMAGENNVDILSIVGPHGVGKTTLALHCFYDPKVQKHFSLKIYIPLSIISYPNNGCPPKIFEYILKQCKSTPITNNDENTLLAMLKQNLSLERILLVINDVWLVNSRVMNSTVWNAVLGSVRCGKQGSKIIFISDLIFYNKIKEIVKPGKVQPIILDGFSEEEYMLFFKEHAFGSADPEDHPELAKMGGEIAKKMNGSIWGAKIIGELLRDNLNGQFWSIFLRDGFISSQFVHNKGLFPVIWTISQLLPKRLKVVARYWCRGYNNEHKSYRELMVLGPKYCTPVIIEGENYEMEFSVTKHFNLYECFVLTAHVELLGDDQ
ncbi:disease resistance protein RGA2-like [Carex rostrata]